MLRTGLSQQQQINLLTDLSAFVRAGLPPYETIAAVFDVVNKKKKHGLAKCLKMVLKRMDAGKSLAQSLSGIMDGTSVAILAAGEQSGDVARAAKEAAEVLSVRREMTRTLLKSMTAPLVQFVALTLLVYYVSLQVVPAAKRLLPEEHMSDLSRSYFAFGEWFIDWGLISAGAVGVCAILVVATFGSWSGALRAKMDAMFPWTIYRYIQGGAVLIALSSMMRAGIPFGQAIESTAKLSSPWVRWRLTLCRSHLAKGRAEAESLSLSGLLPPEIDDRLSVYSRLPDFPVIMGPLAREAFDLAKAKLQSFALLLSGASMFLIAAFILITVFGLGDAAMSAADAAAAGAGRI